MLCWLHHQSRAFANTSLTGHWSLATYLLGSSGSQYRFYGIKLLERCPLRQSVLQEQGSARNLGEATLMDMEEINLIETNIPRKPRSVRMIWFHFQRHIDLIIFSVCWSFSGEGDGLEQRAARNCSQIGGRPVIRSRSIGFHSSQPVLSRSPHSWGTVYVGKLLFPGGIGWWSKLGSTYKKTPAILELQHESYGPMVIFQENLLPWSQDLPPQPFRLILNGLMIIQQFDCRHPSQHSRTVGSEVGYFSCCSRRHWVVQTFFFFFLRASRQFIRIIFGSNCTLELDLLCCRMDHFEFWECLHNYTHIISVRSTMDQESSFGSPFISFDWSFVRGMLHALVKLNKAAADQTGKWSLFVLDNPQPSKFSFLRSQISIQSKPANLAVQLQQT